MPRIEGSERFVFKRLFGELASLVWVLSLGVRGPRSRRPERGGVGDVEMTLETGRLEVDD